jgi:hypothetical protein
MSLVSVPCRRMRNYHHMVITVSVTYVMVFIGFTFDVGVDLGVVVRF